MLQFVGVIAGISADYFIYFQNFNKIMMSLVPVPSMPLKVRVSEIGNTSVILQWSEPAEPKGEIQGYRLYYMKNNNFTDVVTVRETGKSVQHIIEKLGEEMKCKM